MTKDNKFVSPTLNIMCSYNTTFSMSFYFIIAFVLSKVLCDAHFIYKKLGYWLERQFQSQTQRENNSFNNNAAAMDIYSNVESVLFLMWWFWCSFLGVLGHSCCCWIAGMCSVLSGCHWVARELVVMHRSQHTQLPRNYNILNSFINPIANLQICRLIVHTHTHLSCGRMVGDEGQYGLNPILFWVLVKCGPYVFKGVDREEVTKSVASWQLVIIWLARQKFLDIRL